VQSGAPYQCTFQLTNSDPNHCVENLTFTATAPIGENAELVDCTQGGVAVTRLGWSGSGFETCTGTINEIAPFNCGPNTLFFQDEVAAEGTDQGGVTPLYEPDNFTGLPVSNSPSGTVQVPPLDCPGALCNEATCSTETGCGLLPLTSSVDPDCTDTDANNCTQPGCEAGVCVQNHVEEPCEPLVCNTAACDETGACIQTPVDDSFNDPLCTNTDTDNCTLPGCEAGVCVQNHSVTTCEPEVCNTAACDETGACIQTPVDDSTTDPLCTDTDADICTIPGCEAGQCVQTHQENPECEVEIVCRTPGFWGTHGGEEKSGSEPTTCDVLANFGGTLVICGEPITNCDLCSDESALEAICASPKGDSSLQLARQLTAAALNCAITQATDAEGACVPTAVDGANPCAGLGTIEDLFQACNTNCPGSLTGGNTIPCIGLIDCFNNGFAIEFDEETNTFSCGELTGCEENESGCFDQTEPKPAGSSFECRDSRKNCVTIFGTIEDCVDPICE
jgi:hypothetical protein